jgi:hypothetical protein
VRAGDSRRAGWRDDPTPPPGARRVRPYRHTGPRSIACRRRRAPGMFTTSASTYPRNPPSPHRTGGRPVPAQGPPARTGHTPRSRPQPDRRPAQAQALRPPLPAPASTRGPYNSHDTPTSSPGSRPSYSTCRARQPAQAVRTPLAVHASTWHPYNPHNTPSRARAGPNTAAAPPSTPQPGARVHPPRHAPAAQHRRPAFNAGRAHQTAPERAPRPLPPPGTSMTPTTRAAAQHRPSPLDSGHPHQARHACEPRRTA